ncbi:uncharacterized protein EV420DRAFT_1709745, partial [Desarmillaria tabescens]
MIWCCWIIWGKHWLVIVLPSLCLICGVGKVIHFFLFKIIAIHLIFIDYTTATSFGLILYASFTLATTLWCTMLTIYHILSVGQVNNGIRGALGVYGHVIEVLVESSALYSVCLILYVTLTASNSWGHTCLDTITGIAPTLLIGHVAAGHACPDDSW